MKKIKQVVAIVMCVLLVGMYVASFVAAIFAKPQAHGLFMASVGMTIMIPLLLYAYTIITGLFILKCMRRMECIRIWKNMMMAAG